MEFQTSCQSCISSIKLQGQFVTVHTNTVHCIQVTRQLHDPITLTPNGPHGRSWRFREASAGNRVSCYPARNLLINPAPYFFHTRYEYYTIVKGNILELVSSTYSSPDTTIMLPKLDYQTPIFRNSLSSVDSELGGHICIGVLYHW